MSKYNSVPTFVDDIPFDSRLESLYFVYLKERLAKGEIKKFTLQPVYELTPAFEKNGKKIRPMTYKPDFLIRHNDDTMEAIEIKGFMTQASEMRIKLFNYRYQNIKLTVLSYCKKYGGFIGYDELKKVRKGNKK